MDLNPLEIAGLATGGTQMLCIGIDSGAARSAVPRDGCMDNLAVPTAEGRAQVRYRAATGTEVLGDGLR